MICLLDSTKICQPICQLDMIHVLRGRTSLNLLLVRTLWRFLWSLWYLPEQWSIRRETFSVVFLPHQIVFLNPMFASPMHGSAESSVIPCRRKFLHQRWPVVRVSWFVVRWEVQIQKMWHDGLFENEPSFSLKIYPYLQMRITLNSGTYRQQRQHLERCIVICCYKHALCTNFGSILVVSHQLSCKHLPLKSIKSWLSKYRQRSGICFLMAHENLLDMCVCWNRFRESLLHAVRGGWTSHRNFLTLDGNPCRPVNACGVVTLVNHELSDVTGFHVDDFLIALTDGVIGEKRISEIQSLYRWGSWKASEAEFAGIRMRRHRDSHVTIRLSWLLKNLSMSHGVLGTASSKAQQMSPQFAVDVSLLLCAAAHPVVQDLLDANKLVPDMRRRAAQSLHFHSFNETPWQQLFFGAWADASDRPRLDGSRTAGYVKTLAQEKLFRQGQEDDVSVMAWRSFKLLRKIAGSNNGETQALAFADEALWLARFAWSEMHGASILRWHLNETVRRVGGSSVQVFEISWCLDEKWVTSASIAKRSHRRGSTWNQGTECSLKRPFTGAALWPCWQTARPNVDTPLVLWWHRSWWRNVRNAHLTLPFDTGKRRNAGGAPLFSNEDIDDVSPLTYRAAFDTLFQDVSFSEDVREIMRIKYELHRRVSFWACEDRGKVSKHARHEHTSSFRNYRFWQLASTRLVLCTWRVSRLSIIPRWPCFSPFVVRTSFSRLARVRRTRHVTVGFCVLCYVELPDESCGTSRVLGNYAVGQQYWNLTICTLQSYTEHQHGSTWSQSWNDTKEISTSLRECWHPSEMCSQVLSWTVLRLCASFSFSCQGSVLLTQFSPATDMSRRSLIQLDWQCCRPVAQWRSGCEITCESLRTLTIVVEHLSSDQFTQTSQFHTRVEYDSGFVTETFRLHQILLC